MRNNGSKLSLLLVEDSEDDVFFFRAALRKSGHDCDLKHAADGAIAMAWLKSALEGREPIPDFVFLDLKLPGFDGFEILAWIREQPFHPPLDVAILSGSEHPTDMARARALGATSYFVKPISAAQIRARLEPAMAGRSDPAAAHPPRAGTPPPLTADSLLP
jgi:DNA-binding response OmpR family regulator